MISYHHRDTESTEGNLLFFGRRRKTKMLRSELQNQCRLTDGSEGGYFRLSVTPERRKILRVLSASVVTNFPVLGRA